MEIAVVGLCEWHDSRCRADSSCANSVRAQTALGDDQKAKDTYKTTRAENLKKFEQLAARARAETKVRTRATQHYSRSAHMPTADATPRSGPGQLSLPHRW